MEQVEQQLVPKKGPEFLDLPENIKEIQREMEGRVKGVQKAGEDRIERVVESLGISGEEVKRMGDEIVIEKRWDHLLDKMRDLVEKTKDRVKLLLGGEVELGEEDIEILEEEYEPFDPEEELKKVTKLSPEDTDGLKPREITALKRQRLKEYKKELMRQKEGIAQLQVRLSRQIEKNSDLSVEELMEQIKMRSLDLRLTEKQQNLFREIVEAYHKKHEIIKETREKYPDDRELFRQCFGFEPKGEIEVLEGPMSFYFKCSSPDDFVNIYIADRRRLGAEVGEAEKQFASGPDVGAQVPRSSLVPELKEILIVENSKFVHPEAAKGLRDHEERHVANRLFEEKTLRHGLREKMKFAKTKKEREVILLPYLRFLREEQISQDAKDEILAHYKQRLDPEQIYNRMIASVQERGSYDYLSRFGDVFRKDLKTLGIEKKLAESSIEKVFKKEYWTILNKSLESVFDLEEMGKSREEVIEFLVTEPLEKWPEVVRRLKEAKEK